MWLQYNSIRIHRMSYPNRTVPCIRPHDLVLHVLEIIKCEPYIPPVWRYRTIYSATDILRLVWLAARRRSTYMVPNLNRLKLRVLVVNSVPLEYYLNRTLWRASIGTPIRFRPRSEILSREAIWLENARYGPIRFDNVWCGIRIGQSANSLKRRHYAIIWLSLNQSPFLFS
jgi:hypothetical protein